MGADTGRTFLWALRVGVSMPGLCARQNKLSDCGYGWLQSNIGELVRFVYLSDNTRGKRGDTLEEPCLDGVDERHGHWKLSQAC